MTHRASATTPTYPLGPPRKQWYDKLADAILGDDDAGAASPSSRYALICEKCFTHNGLVKEGMWEDARKSCFPFLSIRLTLDSPCLEYVCPKCGHFNASVRTKRDRSRQHITPSSSAASSPAHPSTLTPGPRYSPEPSSPAQAGPSELERDLPTVDGEESMTMEVDPKLP